MVENQGKKGKAGSQGTARNGMCPGMMNSLQEESQNVKPDPFSFLESAFGDFFRTNKAPDDKSQTVTPI